MAPGDPNDEHDTGGESTDGTVYCTKWDTESESATVAVVRTIAAYSGKDPLTMEPLYYTIDLEPIDQLFPANGSDLTITFSAYRYQITIEEESIKIQTRT